jgi:hypothetical protein
MGVEIRLLFGVKVSKRHATCSTESIIQKLQKFDRAITSRPPLIPLVPLHFGMFLRSSTMVSNSTRIAAKFAPPGAVFWQYSSAIFAD